MKNDLKLEILEKMSTLVTAGFGLVAALAWNSTIQALFAKIFPKQDGIIPMFIYAVVVTVVVVLVTIKLGRAVNKVKKELGLTEEGCPEVGEDKGKGKK